MKREMKKFFLLTNGTWTGAAGDGLWSDSGNWLNGQVATGSAYTAYFNAVDITSDPTVVHLNSPQTIGSLVFGDLNTNTAAGWLLDNNGNAANTLTLTMEGPSNVVVNALGAGKQVTIGAILAGSEGLKKAGFGTLDLTNVNTLTGNVYVSQGTLTLDYSGGASTVLGSQVLSLGGGSLTVLGLANNATTQTFTSTTLNAGQNVITAVNGAGSGTTTVNLGSFGNPPVGGIVEFIGPATITAATTASGNGGGGGTGTATGTITTTTGTVNQPFNDGGTGLNENETAYATVGLYDFATVTSSSPYTVIGMSQGSAGTAGFGGYIEANGTLPTATEANLTTCYDMVGSFTLPANAYQYGGWRFNANAYSSVTINQVTGASLLVTPNVGANNIEIIDGSGVSGALEPGARNGSQAGSLILWQNNTQGFLQLDNKTLWDGKEHGSAFVQAGPGTILYIGTNGYTGPTYLNNGVAAITSGYSFGTNSVNTGTVYLNGGAVVAATNSVTLDNAGASPRPILLSNNGGGLGAGANCTLTVDGVVTGSAPLLIGIPPSSANSFSTIGRVPGTGAGTANLTEWDATGTVLLSSGANTYSGGVVLYSGVLTYTTGSLGTGGYTFSGGTFQWPANTPSDLSSQTVTFNSAGGTLDLNGNTVTLYNSIGNGGPGGFTTISSTGSGVLNLNSPTGNSYSGATTIGTNTTVNVNNTSGSATGSGNVNVNGVLAGGGAIAGSVTVGATGQTYPSGGGAASTNTLGGNLTYTAGAAVPANANFVLSSSATGGDNDQIILNGAGSMLTPNGVSVGISCGATLDRGNPYVLFNLTGGGSVSGSFNRFPVWLASTPTTASGYGYEVVVSGNEVLLACMGAPQITAASASPNPVEAYQTLTINATVTQGSDPNPVNSVMVNLAAIGLGSSVALTGQGANNYAVTQSVPYNVSPGAYTLPVMAQDALGGLAISNLTVTVAAPSATSGSSSQTWDGLGGDNNWSTAGNWTDGVAPGFGDNLYFDGLTVLNPVINLNYTMAGVTFNSGAGGFNLTASGGSALTLTGGVTNLSSNPQTLTVPITLNAAMVPVSDAGSGVVLSGVVSGSGNGLATTGKVSLTAANTYSGNTAINAGTLALGATGSLSTRSISLAGGATFDVSSQAAYLFGNTALTASGDPAASIIGQAGGTVSLGSAAITLIYDGTTPALTIPQGTLVLNGNQFTINSPSGSPVPPGIYNVIQQTSGSITDESGTYPTPTGTAEGKATISVSGGNVVLSVSKGTPVVTWASPAAIQYGIALSTNQLDASANAPGTFAYNPPLGAILNPGSNQTLSVIFTPTAMANYNSVTDSVSLTVFIPALTFTTLHSFEAGDNDGANPDAGLLLSEGVLYGTTYLGGTSGGRGTVFVVNTNGAGYAILHSFTNTGTAGQEPYAGLILSGNTLYGTTLNGGGSGEGSVFQMNTDGTGYTVLHNFSALSNNTNSDGALPYAGLILSGNILYGTAEAGGRSGDGTVFAINTNGTGFTTLHTFSALNNSTNSDGANPYAGLILSGNTLYGTAEGGGISGSGTVFAVSTNGSGFTNLHYFTCGSDGCDPHAGLIISGNTLYGTTSAGGLGDGTIFAVNTDGTGFTNLHYFTCGSDGCDPHAGLILSGNTLYGTAEGGGAIFGTVFAVNTDGTDFATLYTFTNGSDGGNPSGGLVLSGNTLYGTTSEGGDNQGTVFALGLTTPPLNLTQVESQTNPAFTTVTFEVAAYSSTAAEYQWFFDGTNLTDNSQITGSQSNILTINSALAGNTGSYQVVITNLYGSATSAVVTLTVSQLSPVITWATPANITYGTALSTNQLDASANVPGTFAYTPPLGAILDAGSNQTLSVTFTPTDTADYSTNSSTVTINVQRSTPVITWAAPAGITYGTALSATQLDATANVGGSFVYRPPAGTVLEGGSNQTLTATFTPSDATDYSTNSSTVTINVQRVAPVITWAAPAAITYGAALSSSQLNATANAPGWFVYNPPPGAVLATGSNQTLTATFTPSDTADYFAATNTVTINVQQATPVITWAAPAAITYGAALSSSQLDASANTAGTFVYNPPSGTVLGAGNNQTLSATFTPSDKSDYSTATATVTINVQQATPVITWAAPAGITYGTALGTNQLNASANVQGAFVYNPASGTMLGAGSNQSLSVTFTPSDTTNYSTATATVRINVRKAAPVVTWPAPAAITYGTALGSNQLDATANIPGSFTYTPSAGTILYAGNNQTLSAAFTPSDATDYSNATATVMINVQRATPVITWAAPAAIIYGTALSSNQLDATANVSGSFAYTPSSGAVLGAGSNQTLAVTFTPADTADYFSAGANVTINVLQAASIITWAAPAGITYGTALSSTQLDATANVTGSFAYNPAAGAILGAGSNQTLSVTFTPLNTGDYSTATATVSINVQRATPVITWAAPAAIAYGAALSSNQLDATASVAGSFAYNPLAGAMLPVGSNQTLSVTFTPTDMADYSNATAAVTINVQRAAPIITWAAPAAITYGTALSSNQLNATANVQGAFVYNPTNGTVLGAGSNQSLSVTFTPSNTTDYSNTTATVAITVQKATPTVTWAEPAGITYGAALSSSQLNATANVQGTFAYNPLAGTVLGAGINQNLSVTFTPTDTVDYNSVTDSVSLGVAPGALTVTAANASRAYGQPNPAFTGTITGLTNGDNITATYSCSATTNCAAGNYAIVPALVDPSNRQTNYAVSLVPGTLTVNQPASQFTFASATYSVQENGATVTLTVVNNAGLTGYVSYETVDGSAHGGNGVGGDYTATEGNLSFSGQSSLAFSIPIIDNYINGPDLRFQVQLLNPTVGSIGSPSSATVTIIRDDSGAATNALLAQVLPTNRPAMNGQLTVWLPPAQAGEQWRFPWEYAWRNSGSTASNLVAGDYPVQFSDVPGYEAILLTDDFIVTNGETTVATNQYYSSEPASSAVVGSLTVNVTPANLTAIAGWQFVGETAWRASGSTAGNLLPGTYLVAFEQVIGYTTPTSLAVLVSNGMSVTVSGNYTPAPGNTTGADLPELLSTSKILNYTSGPYGFSGQLQTDAGSGSGAAVTANVVLTAAHMVFNDNTLSYVTNAWWSFQEQAGVFEPEPQAARGWYVLSGYAAQRDWDITSNSYVPDQPSPQSQDMDVAALYFLTYSARTGFGGFISSDAVPNPYLTGSALKTLVGYPVDGSMFDQVVSPGGMYATPLDNQAFVQTNDQVYAASWLFSYPGNSGGPLCVQYANNGLYYPVAVYLGTLFNGSTPDASVVRAIDSNVVNLISMASEAGDYGTNNSGGNFITIIPSQAVSLSNPAYLMLELGPPSAVQAGAAWKLTNQPDSCYSTGNPSLQEVTTTSTLVVQFKPIPGWNLPTNRSVTVVPGLILTNVVTYTVANPRLTLDLVNGLGMFGTTNTTYQIQSNSLLTGGTWIPFQTNILTSPGFNLITNKPRPGFYRALWLTN
ncbi:MAG: choice-of-anchor tandem repeat GloVer-containing protein [Verrucomicrobiota bacterium]